MIGTTEAEPEDTEEMETEFSKEDDETEYYADFEVTTPFEETTSPPVSDQDQSETSGNERNIETENETSGYEDYHDDVEKYSVIDEIIEEAQKTPGEKLLEKMEKSKILERILPQPEEPDRDSLLSKIIKMFGK